MKNTGNRIYSFWPSCWTDGWNANPRRSDIQEDGRRTGMAHRSRLCEVQNVHRQLGSVREGRQERAGLSVLWWGGGRGGCRKMRVVNSCLPNSRNSRTRAALMSGKRGSDRFRFSVLIEGLRNWCDVPKMCRVVDNISLAGGRSSDHRRIAYHCF